MRMEVSDQKNTGIFAEKIASLHQEIQNRRPLVQCITNAVTVNDCANILLAAGASPTMAHHPQEAAEISAGCDAPVSYTHLDVYKRQGSSDEKAETSVHWKP